MPKPLREPPPSSSVVRLLDASSASRAISKPEESGPLVQPPPRVAIEPPIAARAPERTPASPQARTRTTGEPANINRELVLSPSADNTFTRLVDLCKRSTGTRLTSSHVARAVFRCIEQSLPAIEREASQIGPLRLPSNARGREGEREAFEGKIAEAIMNGVRKSAAYDPSN